MPSQRKRIGFLPRAEVQDIIDQICKNNKLSQSKVTGILVEEALTHRGVLISSINKETEAIFETNKNLHLVNKSKLVNERQNDVGNFNFDESYLKEEINMINEYIEFKFFKKIMIKNNKRI